MTKSAQPGHESPGSRKPGPEEVAARLNSCTVGEAEPEQGDGSSAASPARARACHRFEDVYDQYFEFVWRSLRMLGVQRAALDDAVQDVFGVVSRQLDGFEGRSSLRTWLFGIVQYTANNHRRGERRKSAPLEPLHEGLPSREPGPQLHAEASQLARCIFEFCEELDEGRRSVFVLGVLEEVAPAEIAQLLQIPVNTVYSRLRTLRQSLRERLSARERGLPSAPGAAEVKP
jgi:RNA polymerase sigma-70 factor, ECF subfamily